MWSVGCTECDGPAQFGRLIDLELDPRGTVLALDARTPFVRRITADGSAVQAFVHDGQGPGEVESPRLAFNTATGGFGVVEYFRRTLLLYDSRGEYLRTIALETGRIVTADYAHATSTLHVLHVPILERDAPFILTAVGLAPGAKPVREFSQSRTRGVAAPSYFVSFARDSNGRVAMGFGDRYEIILLAANGTPAGEIRRYLPRRRRPAEEVERQRRAVASVTGTSGRNVEVDLFYRHFYFDALDFASDGSLWVLSARRYENGTLFDVFDADGRLLGSAAIDGYVKPTCSCFAVAGHRLVAATTGSDGVDRVRAWRIPDSLRSRTPIDAGANSG